MEKYHGFPPLFDGNSKILILGSFPSVKSRQQQFYYGNKQNRFWKTLCWALDVPVENASKFSVEEKKKLCLKHGVALWDIVESCAISGSMDSAINDYVLVDLSTVLDNCNITKILCNGVKAYQLALSAYKGNVPLYKMPSTSPANVTFDAEKWRQALREK